MLWYILGYVKYWAVTVHGLPIWNVIWTVIDFFLCAMYETSGTYGLPGCNVIYMKIQKILGGHGTRASTIHISVFCIFIYITLHPMEAEAETYRNIHHILHGTRVSRYILYITRYTGFRGTYCNILRNRPYMHMGFHDVLWCTLRYVNYW